MGIIAVIVMLAMEDWEKFIKIFWYFCFVIIALKCYFGISGNRNLAERVNKGSTCQCTKSKCFYRCWSSTCQILGWSNVGQNMTYLISNDEIWIDLVFVLFITCPRILLSQQFGYLIGIHLDWHYNYLVVNWCSLKRDGFPS